MVKTFQINDGSHVFNGNTFTKNIALYFSCCKEGQAVTLTKDCKPI